MNKVRGTEKPLFDHRFDGLIEDWGRIEEIWATVHKSVQKHVKPFVIRRAFHLAFVELTENLLTHADWASTHSPTLRVCAFEGEEVSITSRSVARDVRVEFHTENISKSSDVLDRLQESIAALGTQDKIDALYDARLKARLLGQTPRSESTQLGFLRLVDEAAATIKVDVENDCLVKLQVSISLADMLAAVRQRQETD